MRILIDSLESLWLPPLTWTQALLLFVHCPPLKRQVLKTEGLKYKMFFLLIPPQAHRLVSSSADKLYESGLDEGKALAEMNRHVGQLLGWLSTYIPPAPITGLHHGLLKDVDGGAEVTIGTGMGHARRTAPAGWGGLHDAPSSTAVGSCPSIPGWRGGCLDMGPNSRQGWWTSARFLPGF